MGPTRQTQNQRQLERHLQDLRTRFAFMPELEAFLRRDESTIAFARAWDNRQLGAMRIRAARATERQFSISLEIPLLIANYGGETSPLQPRILRRLEGEQLRGDMATEKDIAILVAADPRALDFVRDRERFGYPVLVLLVEDLQANFYRDRSLRSELARLLKSVNHFDFNGEIVEAADFFGRTSEIRDVVRNLATGNSVGLFGLRRAGKTSLLYRAMEELRSRGFATPYLQLNAVDDGDGFREELVQSVARVLDRHGSRVPDDLYLIDRARRFRSGAEGLVARRWIYDLNQLLDVLDRETVFVIDETDRANEESGDIDAGDYDERKSVNRALQQLRGLIQLRAERGRKRACVFSAGVAASVYSSSVRFGHENQLFGFVTPRPLGPMPYDEMRSMVRTLGKRSGLAFSDVSVVDALYDEYGGHPHLTRRACAEVAHYCHRLPDVQVPHQVRLIDLDAAFTSGSESSPSVAAWENFRSFERWYPEEAAVVADVLTTRRSATPTTAPHAIDFGLLNEDGSLRLRALLRTVS